MDGSRHARGHLCKRRKKKKKKKKTKTKQKNTTSEESDTQLRVQKRQLLKVSPSRFNGVFSSLRFVFVTDHEPE
jgi:hypothetical protein